MIQAYYFFFGVGTACEAAAAPAGGLVSRSARNLPIIFGTELRTEWGRRFPKGDNDENAMWRRRSGSWRIAAI